MKGAYVLVIDLNRGLSFHLKSLGNLSFEKGTWLYIGSAMGIGSTNLENRIRRHFRSEKTIYWHIDHLLNSDSSIRLAVWSESSSPKECEIARSIEKMENVSPGPRGFGSSDCKQKCRTHLYHPIKGMNIESRIIDVFRGLSLEPQITRDGNP